MSESGKTTTTPSVSSKIGKTASNGEQGGHPSGSVFDFLYHDVRRVGSFLAQFDDAGHLQQITQGDSAAKGAKAGYKVAVNASLGEVVGLPGGGLSVERNPAEAGSSSSHRTYDPLWTNARAFLDFADGLLERDLTNATIGQMVLIKGGLWVVDTTLLREMSKGTHFKRQINAGVTSAAKNKQQGGAQAKGAEFGMELLQSLPVGVQARFDHQGAHLWGSLSPEGLTSSPGDLFLKHGVRVEGEWATVGILDAVPEEPKTELQIAMESTINMATLGAMVGPLATLASTMRPLLGRPADAYGITPLLVFREVSSRTA